MHVVDKRSIINTLFCNAFILTQFKNFYNKGSFHSLYQSQIENLIISQLNVLIIFSIKIYWKLLTKKEKINKVKSRILVFVKIEFILYEKGFFFLQ